VKTFAIFFGESCFVVIFEERIYSSQKLLG
jgi:hypothetical protein